MSSNEGQEKIYIGQRGEKRMKLRFDTAIAFLPDEIKRMLINLNDEIKKSAYEIRIRTGKCLVIETSGGTYFVGRNRVSGIFSDDLYKVSKHEMKDSFNRLCGFSVYSHLDTISQCFVTLPSGHRVGICGTAVTENGKVSTIRDVSSLNIRIAGEYKGCADEVLARGFGNRLCNVIIAGPPSSGKTTLLRDIARQISGGRFGEYYKVSVIDERCEISPVSDGVCLCDMGPNTDVLSLFKKADGIICALRALSPHLIICDEIGTEDECEAIKSALNSGVSFALSIHASSKEELFLKPQFKTLLRSGIEGRAVILSSEPCKIKEIIQIGENNAQIVSAVSAGSSVTDVRSAC